MSNQRTGEFYALAFLVLVCASVPGVCEVAKVPMDVTDRGERSERVSVPGRLGKGVIPDILPIRDPDFVQRLDARARIEELRWRNTEWPAANPDPKPTAGPSMASDAIRARVEDYLRKSAALEQFWNRPITPSQLQAELDRMAAGTRAPERLAMLFHALDDDGRLLAENVARPALADRLIRNWYARDERYHGATRSVAVEALADMATVSRGTAPGYYEVATTTHERYDDDGDVATIVTDEAGLARWREQLHALYGLSSDDDSLPLYEWTGLQEDRDTFYALGVLETAEDVIVTARAEWPKRTFDDWWSETSHLVAPRIETSQATYTLPAIGGADCVPDSWTATPIVSAPTARGGHTAVWTGVEMIVWGGGADGRSVSTGSRYNPATDTWNATAPTMLDPRGSHTAVWTGSEMIVWGGNLFGNGPGLLGGRYDPVSDTWSVISTAGAPSAQVSHAAVWTGNRMAVWGGRLGGSYMNTGGFYDPASDSWTATTTVGAPSPRTGHSLVWTGSELVVWGGLPFSDDGGRYDPATDSWRPTSWPDVTGRRYLHSAVWTGSEMIVWGGKGSSTSVYSDGSRYDPVADTWNAISSVATPSQRYLHLATWTGSEMIVWGGQRLSSLRYNTGGRYDPATDTWTPTSTSPGVPTPRTLATAVWTGGELLVWGGYDTNETDTGARYDFAADSWTPISAGDQMPLGRSRHVAVWTGSEMILWAGIAGAAGKTGTRYDPTLDTWTPTAVDANVPITQTEPKGFWTGTEMLVFGTEARGGRYDPATDSWTRIPPWPIAPSQRFRFSAVWTGTEMIIWGGQRSFTYQDVGGRYNPATDSWTDTSTVGAPTARRDHEAVWTGTEMVVWGGNDGDDRLQSGGRYDPVTDSWHPTTDVGAPDAREDFTAIWTGDEMIVWGGDGGVGGRLSSGGRYDPATDSWTPTSDTSQTPVGRLLHSAIWTGSEMIIWGGTTPHPVYDVNSGGRYNPIQDTWQPTSEAGRVPPERSAHTAVWTGSEMIVWGGGSDEPRSGGRYCPPNPPPAIECSNPVVPAGPTCDAELECVEVASCTDPGGAPVSLVCAPDGPYGPGTSQVTVECSDASTTVSAVCPVLVEDRTPPEIFVELDPSILWPPNHRMVEVTASISVEDNCGPASMSLVSLASNEPDNAIGQGDGNTVHDIQNAEPGTDDREFSLRAERSAQGSGRTYTVTYLAADGSSNVREVSHVVFVPLNRGTGTATGASPPAGTAPQEVVAK